MMLRFFRPVPGPTSMFLIAAFAAFLLLGCQPSTSGSGVQAGAEIPADGSGGGAANLTGAKADVVDPPAGAPPEEAPVKTGATRAPGKAAPGKSAAEWLPALTSPDGVERKKALSALTALESAAKPASQALLALLAKKDAPLEERQAAAAALVPCGPQPEVGRKILREVLNHEVDGTLRSLTALALGAAARDEEGEESSTLLLDVFKAEGVNAVTELRFSAAEGLALLANPARANLIPTFERWLTDGDTRVANAGIKGMAAIGKPALPLIRKMLRTEQPRERYVAVRVLSGMNKDEVEDYGELLAARLRDTGVKVRLQAFRAMSQVPELAGNHISEVARGLKDSAWQIRRESAVVLRTSRTDSKEALELLKSQRDKERHFAVRHAMDRAVQELEKVGG